MYLSSFPYNTFPFIMPENPPNANNPLSDFFHLVQRAGQPSKEHHTHEYVNANRGAYDDHRSENDSRNENDIRSATYHHSANSVVPQGSQLIASQHQETYTCMICGKIIPDHFIANTTKRIFYACKECGTSFYSRAS